MLLISFFLYHVFAMFVRKKNSPKSHFLESDVYILF